MCRQQDLIRAALHDAVDEYATWLIETEILRRSGLRRSGATKAHERAEILAKRLQTLCATLQELLALHRTAHGC